MSCHVHVIWQQTTSLELRVYALSHRNKQPLSCFQGCSFWKYIYDFYVESMYMVHEWIMYVQSFICITFISQAWLHNVYLQLTLDHETPEIIRTGSKTIGLNQNLLQDAFHMHFIYLPATFITHAFQQLLNSSLRSTAWDYKLDVWIWIWCLYLN